MLNFAFRLSQLLEIRDGYRPCESCFTRSLHNRIEKFNNLHWLFWKGLVIKGLSII